MKERIIIAGKSDKFAVNFSTKLKSSSCVPRSTIEISTLYFRMVIILYPQFNELEI
jgi:hypothetical protein